MDYIRNMLSNLALKGSSEHAKTTLFGLIMIKFATGGIVILPNLSIYYFSYFKMNGKNEDLSYASISTVAAIFAIIFGLCSLLSIKISNHIKDSSTILKWFLPVYPISIMISSTTETFHAFALFNLYIPAVSLGVCLIPVSKCLWSNFREEKGKATGIVTFTFGISSFAYILFSTYYVNYENVSPSNEFNEGT